MALDRGRTPTDHVVIGLHIDAALLPGWFSEIERVAAGRVRRMAVLDRPGKRIVRCELRKDRVEAFTAALQRAWDAFPHALPRPS